MTIPRLSRRSVLKGFAVSAVSGIAGYVVARGSSAADEKPVTAAANAYGPRGKSPSADAAPLAQLADVPEAGLIVAKANVVLVKTGAEVRALSATCTHQGCTVDAITDGVITCPCHGSRFDASTGAVRSGPAQRALPPVAVVVRDGFVYRA